MAILSNINDKFAVDSTGAIQFNGQAGTSGYVLKSNGNAAPTWVAASTVIGGPYLSLSGGTLTGATSTASGISFTVGGTLTGTTADFTGSITSTGLTVQAGTYHKFIVSFPSTYKTNLQIGQQLNISNDAITDTVTFANTGAEAVSEFLFTIAGNPKLKI